MAVNWDYFNKFDEINDVFLPVRGEGDTKATQIVTAVNKLVYKWYNDGDVFDNTGYLTGWVNDLSSYANWLYQNTDVHVQEILDGVCDCNADDYEELLKELADTLLDTDVLEEYDKESKVGSIYDCEGPFKFVEDEDEDEDEYEEDEEW